MPVRAGALAAALLVTVATPGAAQTYTAAADVLFFGDNTEFAPAPTFYYAEPYHQQYLSKNPNGYCGHGGTGVSCPIGARV